MTPLIFISIITLVLLALVYWVISSKDTNPENRKWEFEKQDAFHYESAEELFRFAETNDAENSDILRLKPGEESVYFYWNISNDTWDNALNKYQLPDTYDDIIIRLYDPNGDKMDTMVDTTVGGRRVKTGDFHTNYAILGIRKEDEFWPLFLSTPVE